jgi:hypothetical protein
MKLFLDTKLNEYADSRFVKLVETIGTGTGSNHCKTILGSKVLG